MAIQQQQWMMGTKELVRQPGTPLISLGGSNGGALNYLEPGVGRYLDLNVNFGASLWDGDAYNRFAIVAFSSRSLVQNDGPPDLEMFYDSGRTQPLPLVYNTPRISAGNVKVAFFIFRVYRPLPAVMPLRLWNKNPNAGTGGWGAIAVWRCFSDVGNSIEIVSSAANPDNSSTANLTQSRGLNPNMPAGAGGPGTHYLYALGRDATVTDPVTWQWSGPGKETFNRIATAHLVHSAPNGIFQTASWTNKSANRLSGLVLQNIVV